jgi:hypothetical protein
VKQSKIDELEIMMTSPDTYEADANDFPNSIMFYGQICNHDDGFLCECRREFILNYIRENSNETEN